MMFPRPGGLRTLIVCLAGCLPLLAQQPPPQTPPAQAPPAQTRSSLLRNKRRPTRSKRCRRSAEPPKPESCPSAGLAATPDRPPTDKVEAIDFRGARRVPADTLRAMIATKVGEPYDAQIVDRDFITLWNTTQFNDIKARTRAGHHRLDRALRPGGAAHGAKHQVRRARSPSSSPKSWIDLRRRKSA